MEGLVISRNNFRNMRSAYGIKIKDISDKCGVSQATISKFETSDASYMATHAREYNERLMCNTLKEMIELATDAMFDHKPAKQNPVKAREVRLMNGINRKNFVSVIREYCYKNNISIVDFCAMCGISTTVLSEAEAEKHNVVYQRTADKVLKATGWPADIFDKDHYEQEKVETPEEPKPVSSTTITEVQHNVKLVAENGHYYREYDIYVPQHVKKEITKEEFIKEV